ncbi:DUF6161 domain-containing protein [Gynuella sunshinyii]|uniref:DUF6161 domain-containing protein n=1 Tax=Gynuella sunshinyii YC6258 TaxID=1445510 RepID=A0A0C5VLA5_9GAMM|nr:DUF6161 domain-containing protein [Gynuella sunshinyii]AJQ95487.1 hypothetical Protein YC6258_03451 [Gynuella sunshinyii YC6258]
MNRTINIRITDSTNKSWQFTGLRELYEFIDSEKTYWKEKRDLLAKNERNVHQYMNAHAVLQNITNTIDSWKDNLEAWDDNQFNQQFQNLQRNSFNNLNSQWMWSGHPYSSVYAKCHELHGSVAATAFIDFVVRGQISNNNTRQGFTGLMLAYEFINQDSELVKRRNGEKVSLGHLRNQLNETTSKLIGEVEDFKSDFSRWDEQTRSDWSEWKENVSTAWDEWMQTSSAEHSDQLSSQKDEFINYMDGCRTRIADLENTYQEKLRLEKPADYWKKAARKYGIQGGLWSLALVFSMLLGFVYFYDFFIAWLKGQEIGVKLHTLQGIVIFGSIITVYAFLIKTISRLAFSAFHLMRDAEEREQLTYLYLALNHGGDIDASSREIVLQALFSRTETGLLASESGPTMPGMAELIRTASKAK